MARPAIPCGALAPSPIELSLLACAVKRDGAKITLFTTRGGALDKHARSPYPLKSRFLSSERPLC